MNTNRLQTLKTASFSLNTLRVASWLLLQGAALAAPVRLEPADSPVDNPMKGLVPYGELADLLGYLKGEQ